MPDGNGTAIEHHDLGRPLYVTLAVFNGWLPPRGAGRSELAPAQTAARSVGADGLICDVGGSPVKDERSNFLFGLIPDGKVHA